jgi:hypothetical protein
VSLLDWFDEKVRIDDARRYRNATRVRFRWRHATTHAIGAIEHLVEAMRAGARLLVMLRAAIVGVVVTLLVSAAPAPAEPKRADSCSAVRKREANLVLRLDTAKRRIAQLEAEIAERDRALAAEIQRLEEEQRKLNAKLK